MNILREIHLSKRLGDLKIMITDELNSFEIMCKIDKQMSSWYFNMNYQGKIDKFFPTDYAALKNEIDIYLVNRLACTTIPREEHVFVSQRTEDLFNKIRNELDTWNKSDEKVKINMQRDMYTTTLKCNFTPFKIKNHIYDRLHNRCQDNKYIIIIYLRYIKFFFHNTHLAIPPDILDFMGCDVELFGHPGNTHSTTRYCSPFNDIDRYFGSLGSFFDYQIEPNQVYFANPPFTEVLMDDMAKKIIKSCEEDENVTYFLSIPIWDNSTRRNMDLIEEFDMEYKSYNYLRQSKHFIGTKILTHEQSIFFCYEANKFRFPVSVYLILLSNNPKYNLGKLEEVYSEWIGLARLYAN